MLEVGRLLDIIGLEHLVDRVNLLVVQVVVPLMGLLEFLELIYALLDSVVAVDAEASGNLEARANLQVPLWLLGPLAEAESHFSWDSRSTRAARSHEMAEEARTVVAEHLATREGGEERTEKGGGMEGEIAIYIVSSVRVTPKGTKTPMEKLQSLNASGGDGRGRPGAASLGI